MKILLKLLGVLLSLIIMAVLFLNLLPAPPLKDHSDYLISSASRFYESEGIRMHYEEFNPEAKDTVVLVHGFGGSSYSWYKNIDTLTGLDLRVIAVDLAGYGLSTKGLDIDYSHPAHARRLQALLKDLQIDQASLVGHSMGGNVITHFAAMYPEMTERLILVSGALVLEQPQDLSFFWTFPPLERPISIFMSQLLTEERGREILASAYGSSYKVSEETYRIYILRNEHADWTGSLIGSSRDMSKNFLAYDLKAINVPIHYIWGSEDTWVKQGDVQKIREAFPDLNYIEFDKSGHLPMEEEAERFNELMSKILTD